VPLPPVPDIVCAEFHGFERFMSGKAKHAYSGGDQNEDECDHFAGKAMKNNLEY
jgi:hypothetical protein